MLFKIEHQLDNMEKEQIAAKPFSFGFGLIICSLILAQADGQYQAQQCTEFKSPNIVTTDGTRVGSIQLPINGYREYKPGQICEWVINTKKDDHVIRLQVDSCSLQGKDLYEECNNDYVDIFDTQDDKPVFIGRFCDRDNGQIYESTGQRMVIRFHSDEAYEFGGFTASYQAVKPEPKADKSDNTVHLAVGIPVSILILALLVSFSIAMIRVYRAKKANAQRRRSFNNTPAEGRVTPRPGTLPGTPRGVPDMAPFVDSLNVQGGSGYSYNTRQLPLQVVVPRRPQESLDNERCATPPPPYESLGYEPADLGPYGTGIMPTTPPPYELTEPTSPPYELVVKETGEGIPPPNT